MGRWGLRLIAVSRFSAKQLYEHKNEPYRLCEVLFKSPAHFFTEDGNELGIPFNYAA
jgi:hypothetical protein